jgi:hypothetical protein
MACKYLMTQRLPLETPNLGHDELPICQFSDLNHLCTDYEKCRRLPHNGPCWQFRTAEEWEAFVKEYTGRE